MTTIQIAALVAFAITFILGWFCGYDKGVEDTEKRWSDAVAKDNWEKKYGNRV